MSKLSEINKDELSKICIEFEFNAIGKRLLGDEFVAGRGFEIESQDNDQSNGVLKTISDVDHSYIFVKAQDSEKRVKEIAKLNGKIDNFVTKSTKKTLKEKYD